MHVVVAGGREHVDVLHRLGPGRLYVVLDAGRDQHHGARPDFAAVARAYGMTAERVMTPEATGEAVARALTKGEPAVIELLQEAPS